MTRPNTCTNLIKAINRIAGDGDPVRLSRMMANVVVAQMLPDGVVKGGSSLMFRYGGEATRYTRDVDAARVMDMEQYRKRLEDALAEGWNGFGGKLVAIEPPAPKGVPSSYVMIPFDVKLSYCGRPWQTVRIEIGHNEIGDADEFDLSLPENVAAAFEQLSLPRPRPVPTMKLSYQIAQKLHAVSEPGNERAHDLIDLQLIVLNAELDMAEVRRVCERLFRYRRRQRWPATVVKGEGWERIYLDARATILAPSDILPTVDEAVAWANDLVKRIVGA